MVPNINGIVKVGFVSSFWYSLVGLYDIDGYTALTKAWDTYSLQKLKVNQKTKNK